MTDVPGFEIPKVEDLLWGQTVTGTVERQAAHFYRITVTEGDLKVSVQGISCASAQEMAHADKQVLMFLLKRPFMLHPYLNKITRYS